MSLFPERMKYIISNAKLICVYKIILTESSSSEDESLSPSLSDVSLLLLLTLLWSLPTPAVRRFLEYSRSFRSNSTGSASAVFIG